MEGIYSKRLQVVWGNNVLHTCEGPIEALHRAQRLAAGLRGPVFVYDFKAPTREPSMWMINPAGEIEVLTWNSGEEKGACFH
jgi:hypothetical protein